MENGIKSAVIYTRVSTEDQAKKDLSLPYQLAQCQEFAKKEGYTVLEEFEDPGKSGRNAQRPALQSMLHYITENHVDAVIVYKQDRLSRSQADFWGMIDLFKRINTKFISITEQFGDSAEATISMGMMSSFAQYYCDYLSGNVKKGQKQKVNIGWWPTFAPLGYENYGEKSFKKIRPIKEIAEQVVHAFKLFATGQYSITELTETMIKRGMTSNGGNPISRTAIGRMLRNPIYYGSFYWNGELYKGEHEPILDKELFDSVQAVLDLNRTKGTRDCKHNFMLRGYLYCKCGSMLTGEIKTKNYKNGKSQQFAYYGCKSRKKSKDCSRTYIAMNKIEDMVADLFKNVQFSDEFKKIVLSEAKKIIAEIRDTESDEEKIIRQRIARLNLRMKNAEDDRFDRVITREHFTQVYERIKAELDEANIELSKLSKDHSKTVKVLDELLAFTDDVQNSYLEADNELKRRYLQIFFEKVIVNNGEIVDVIYTPAISQLLEIDRVRITNNWRRGWDSNPRFGKPRTAHFECALFDHSSTSPML